MVKAPLPSNEPERLAALRAYRILDSHPEQVYDDITRLVAHICRVPIATISLVDENRQWFKSAHGIPDRETPRDVAFCAHAILKPEPMIVEDALKDARFRRNVLVTTHPKIRFYAGFPVIDKDGHALGTVCAIDRKPRRLEPEQEAAMMALARQVTMLLEYRRASAQLADSLEHVKTLRGLLPICAWCKRIRDDGGYWEQVEAYLRAKTEAEFTHSICPECSRKVAKKPVAST